MKPLAMASVTEFSMSESQTPDSSSSLISLFEDDTARWQAVQDRNANADGFFVYGVRTTKIFCRPICKARLARRANVSFYDTGSAAQAAGFRACKRCKPEIAGFMPEENAVRKIRAFVAGKPGVGEDGAGGVSMQSLGQMAKQTGLSKWHFHRVFKKCVGVTPVEYLRIQRLAARSGDAASSPEIPIPETGLAYLDSGYPGWSAMSEVPEMTFGADCLSFEDLLHWPGDDYDRLPEPTEYTDHGRS